MKAISSTIGRWMGAPSARRIAAENYAAEQAIPDPIMPAAAPTRADARGGRGSSMPVIADIRSSILQGIGGSRKKSLSGGSRSA